MSLAAVGFVTWMIFWMRRAARSIASELHGRMDKAIAMGTGALVATAFFAVAREGLETALFMWSAVQSAGPDSNPLLGGTLGLLLAVALGWLLYRRAVRINLARFFTWTGAGLVVVAAGVLAYSIHEFQEAGVLPGEDAVAFDVSGTIAPTSLLGTLIRGVFNISPSMSVLQVLAWVAYVGPVLYLFLRGTRTTKPAPSQTAAATTSVATEPSTPAATATGPSAPVAGEAPAPATEHDRVGSPSPR
jgi:high-affinity iron transporter